MQGRKARKKKERRKERKKKERKKRYIQKVPNSILSFQTH